MKAKNLKGLFGKLSDYGDDALHLASNYGDEATEYLIPPPDVERYIPSATDEAYLTNLMAESRLINTYNSPSNAMIYDPNSIYYSDLYLHPRLNGIHLPWLNDVDDFRRDLVDEARGNSLRVLELNDPYANIGQIDFKDGAEGFIQNAEILKYLDTLPDNVSGQDASTLNRLYRRSKGYIHSKFNKYGADAIERAEQFGVPFGDFDWNGVREINHRTAPYWDY